MKETNIDAMKHRKSTHLAGIDVETIVAEKGSCILTIKECFYNTNVDVAGKKTNGYFIEFEEDVKAMMVNSGNRKVIIKIIKHTKNMTDVDSRNIGNWVGLKIELLYDPTVKFAGVAVGGIKIAEKYPLPLLLIGTEQFDNCKTAITKSGYTIDQIKLKYQVSAEVEAALTNETI